MPKKILYESAVHQFLWAGSRLQARWRNASPDDARRVAAWLRALQIENPGAGTMRLSWKEPSPGEHVVDFKSARFYQRGDTTTHAQQQLDRGFTGPEDRVMGANTAFFDAVLRDTLGRAGLFNEATVASGFSAFDAPERKQAEEQFHDAWAASEDVSKINVRQRNEACTAPEMRHLRAALGDLRGRELLDVGCGLGEASVYFALEGAHVTATDVSPGMCDAARQLAEANGVPIETHVSAAEDLRLGQRQFDVIYTGNTLHHADLAATMERLLPHLRAHGTFVSWDPVAYNPLINIYRRIATQVRTPDEHPLRLRDVRIITSHFERVEVRWFWFTTLLVFVCMVAVQWRNPNRERFWKKVVDEADQWAWLYRPLAWLDRILLKGLPFLRPLCWNVVIVGRTPRHRFPPPHA